MKRLLLFLCLLPIFSFGQNVHFYLQPDGTYKSDEGSNYIVLRYDSIPADSLYQMVLMNVSYISIDPRVIVNKVENKSITIHGYSDYIAYKKIPIFGMHPYCGYYTLTFRFKKGKIRVDAPKIDDRVFVRNKIYSYIDIVHKYFEEGNANTKNYECKTATEKHMDELINKLIPAVNLKYNSNW